MGKGVLHAVKAMGCKKDSVDPRDHRFALSTGAVVPESFTLRPFVHQVCDQLNVNSCVANAVANGFKIACAVQGREVRLPSRLALYWHARAYTGDEKVDGGTYIRNAIKALVRFGVSPEDAWPYTTAQAVVNRRPPWRVDRAGWDERGPRGYQRIFGVGDVRLTLARAAIAAGNPVAFGTEVDRAFLESSGPELVDRPNGDVAGRHAMLLVGYEPGRFLVLNSWHSSWRQDGFVYLTDRYISWAQTDDLQILDT